jgi:hypothetical protein
MHCILTRQQFCRGIPFGNLAVGRQLNTQVEEASGYTSGTDTISQPSTIVHLNISSSIPVTAFM